MDGSIIGRLPQSQNHQGNNPVRANSSAAAEGVTNVALRHQVWKSLATNMDQWMRLDINSLMEETQRFLPSITPLSRDECIKLLVLYHVEKLV